MLASIILYKRGFDAKRFFALDDYYDQNRRAYYAALQAADKRTLDLTGWLEYFTDGVAASINAVRAKVLGLSRDVKVLKDKGQVALTARQVKIVEHILANGQMAMKEAVKMLGVSRQAALKEMDKLERAGVVKQIGQGRGAHYVLA